MRIVSIHLILLSKKFFSPAFSRPSWSAQLKPYAFSQIHLNLFSNLISHQWHFLITLPSITLPYKTMLNKWRKILQLLKLIWPNTKKNFLMPLLTKISTVLAFSIRKKKENIPSLTNILWQWETNSLDWLSLKFRMKKVLKLHLTRNSKFNKKLMKSSSTVLKPRTSKLNLSSLHRSSKQSGNSYNKGNFILI